MSDKVISRRKFLVGAGAVVGVAAVSGVGLANRPSPAQAAALKDVPWDYPTVAADQPDPTKLARRAFEVYYASGCAEATWWPVIDALSADNPTTWGTLPKNIMKYGGGGVGGWGSLCGTLNGSSAIIAMTGAPNGLIDAVMQYYADTPLPTNGVDRDVRAGWVPVATESGKTVNRPLPNVPTSTAHSQLCHASLTQWNMTSGSAIGGVGQKDRCAKACYDLVFKTVTLLNAYHANHANIPVTALDPSVTTCQTCHSPNAMGKMACDSCHDETPGHSLGK